MAKSPLVMGKEMREEYYRFQVLTGNTLDLIANDLERYPPTVCPGQEAVRLNKEFAKLAPILRRFTDRLHAIQLPEVQSKG